MLEIYPIVELNIQLLCENIMSLRKCRLIHYEMCDEANAPLLKMNENELGCRENVKSADVHLHFF
jgi:hypothetical protein